MDNQNQQNLNTPPQPPVNPISPTSKKFNNKTIIVLIVIVLTATAVGFLIFKKPTLVSTNTPVNSNYDKTSLSWAYVYGPENGKVKVYLYAPDQSSTINQNPWGFAFEGDTIISGHYKLIMDPSTEEDGLGGGWSSAQVDLGELQFNPKRPLTDGKLHSLQLDQNGYQDSLAFYQYGSSNTDVIYIYRYLSDKFSQVHFVAKNGKVENFTETGLGGELQSNPDGTFTSEWYDNSKGYVTTKWSYNSSDNNLHEIKTAVSTNSSQSASVSSNQKTGCSLLPYIGTTTLSQLPYYSPSYDGVDEDLRGGMICNFAINSKLLVFTFHFLGQPDNTFGNIQITQGDSTKIIQTITNYTDPNALAPAKSSSVLKPVDVNFDGYLDLPVLNNCGATGNCSYDFYLYDPTTNQFLKNSFLTNLGGFKPDQIDSVKKQITASWNSSVADWQQATYQYQGGQYVLIKKVMSSWDRDKNMVTVETYELHDGKMELTNSTTTPE